MQQRRGFAAALLHSLFSLGKLYLYLPQGTVTTMVGTSTQVFAGNAVTGNAPMAFDFLIADEHDRVNAAIDVLLWNTIKGGNSGENDVKTTLNLPKTGAYGTTITRSASPSGIINTDTGTVTRQFADKTVVLTATVSYMGLAAKTKTFNLTVPAIPEGSRRRRRLLTMQRFTAILRARALREESRSGVSIKREAAMSGGITCLCRLWLKSDTQA